MNLRFLINSVCCSLVAGLAMIFIFFGRSYSKEFIISPESELGTLTLAVDYGFSYRTADLTKDVKPDFVDYVNGLRTGTNISGTLVTNVTDILGIGLRFSRFFTENQMSNVAVTDRITGALIGIGTLYHFPVEMAVIWTLVPLGTEYL